MTLECTGSDLCGLAVAAERRQPKSRINSAIMLGRKNFSPLFLFLRPPSIKGRRGTRSDAHMGSWERYLVLPGERMNSLDSQLCSDVKETSH